MRHAKALIFLILACCLSALAGSAPRNGYGTYIATAYSQSGITRSGVVTQRHIVAADPDLIPIGSRIKIKGAGRYSGEYVVADTGRDIQGRRIDIFMPSERSCIHFGRKKIRVKVIQLGDGTKRTTEVATHEVKKDVQNDIKKAAVGGAATEEDWALKAKKTDAATSNTQTAPDAAPAVAETSPAPPK
jgi:3D (Asp-Asp-Asp) domain-containing protein